MKNYSFLSVLALLLFISCTKDSGTITVHYTKAIAIYGDLDEIRNTPLVTEKRTITDPGKVYISSNTLLIGEENNGIHVFDNSNPSNPQNALFIDLPFSKEFFVKDNFIYVESHYDMLKIDISDINNPTLVNRVEFAFSDPLTNQNGELLIGFSFEDVSESYDINDPIIRELDHSDILFYDYVNQLIPPSAVPVSFVGNDNGSHGAVNRITWMNGHVYAIGFSSMTILEDNITGLTLVNNLWAGSQMETIYPSNNHLFIGSRSSVAIYDATLPSNPQYVSEFWHATSCDPVYPLDDIAYVTLRTGDVGGCPGDVNALVTLDISDVSNPIEINSIEMISPFGLTLHENRLYVAEGENGMKIFNASNNSDLSLIHFDDNIEVYDIMPHPDYPELLLTTGPNGINQYEVSTNSFDLTLISSILY